MACRYYDDLIVAKLKKWLPDNSTLRVLKPDESKRFFELTAEDNNDQKFQLPLLAVSRNNDIDIELTIKNPKSYDGLKIYQTPEETLQFNVIPIRLQYQLDIYTKTFEECDEYVRNFLFKLINNPVIKIEIPYNNAHIEHIANIRVLSPVSDTSNISERLFSGQFTRFTIQMEIQDAFLFSLPYRKNWKLYVTEDDLVPEVDMAAFALEVSNKITEPGEIEPIVETRFEK